jgi:hypothetical protein
MKPAVRPLVQAIDFRLLISVATSFSFPLVLFPPLINLTEILVLRQFSCSNNLGGGPMLLLSVA